MGQRSTVFDLVVVARKHLVDLAKSEDSHQRIRRVEVFDYLLVVAFFGVILAFNQLLSLELKEDSLTPIELTLNE